MTRKAIVPEKPKPEKKRDWEADFKLLEAEMVRMGYGSKAMKRILGK